MAKSFSGAPWGHLDGLDAMKWLCGQKAEASQGSAGRRRAGRDGEWGAGRQGPETHSWDLGWLRCLGAGGGGGRRWPLYGHTGFYHPTEDLFCPRHLVVGGAKAAGEGWGKGRELCVCEVSATPCTWVVLHPALLHRSPCATRRQDRPILALTIDHTKRKAQRGYTMSAGSHNTSAAGTSLQSNQLQFGGYDWRHKAVCEASRG